MANQKGDIVSIRGYGKTQFRLTGVADKPETIVQYSPFASEYSDFKTTDASEIGYNYTEASRERYQKRLAEEKDWLEKNNLTESLRRGLDQSAKGETEYIGDFSQYLDDEYMEDTWRKAEEFDRPGNHFVPPWHEVQNFNRR